MLRLVGIVAFALALAVGLMLALTALDIAVSAAKSVDVTKLTEQVNKSAPYAVSVQGLPNVETPLYNWLAGSLGAILAIGIGLIIVAAVMHSRAR